MNNIGYTTRVRVPMIPLNYSNKDNAEVNELMIDQDNRLIYIKTDTGINVYPDSDSIHSDVKDILISKGIFNDNISLGDILDKSEDTMIWMNEVRTSNGDIVGSDDIFKMTKGIRTSETFMNRIYNKVDKVVGKDLVSNNFTNYLKNKLNSIDAGAGIYEHPVDQVCNYSPPVISVNGKRGVVSIYKDDIDGLEGIERNANNYIHPNKKQCMYNFTIKDINGISEKHITVSKESIGLSKIANLDILSAKDVHDNNTYGYITPASIVEYINDIMREEV